MAERRSKIAKTTRPHRSCDRRGRAKRSSDAAGGRSSGTPRAAADEARAGLRTQKPEDDDAATKPPRTPRSRLPLAAEAEAAAQRCAQRLRRPSCSGRVDDAKIREDKVLGDAQVQVGQHRRGQGQSRYRHSRQPAAPKRSPAGSKTSMSSSEADRRRRQARTMR